MFHQLFSVVRNTGISCVLLATTACSFYAPAYSPSFQNVQQLKEMKAPISVAAFSVEKPALNSISTRADTMNSASGSYSSYLKDAITSELKAADKLSTAADPSIPALSAKLLQNEIDVGMSQGEGRIAAQFTLMRDNKAVFDKKLSAKNEFPSSFVAAIAVPNAARSYPTLVEMLLNTLYSDAEFVTATKP